MPRGASVGRSRSCARRTAAGPVVRFFGGSGPTWSLLVLVCLVGGAPATIEAQEPEYETIRIAEGLYQFRAGGHRSFFVVTDEGVVAFDPLSTRAAREYARAIERIAPNRPLKAIVYSHHHGDHATGAPVLRRELGPGAPIIAHGNGRALIAADGDPDLPTPDITFTHRMTLRFGGRPIRLRHVPGVTLRVRSEHADDMLVAHLPEDRVAFAVDFVTNDGVGWRDLPGMDFSALFRALEHLLELDVERVAFGHGPPGDRETVRRQLQYYRDLRTAVEDAVARGWSEDRAAREVELPEYAGWEGYDEWFPLNVRAMYRWLREDTPRP